MNHDRHQLMARSILRRGRRGGVVFNAQGERVTWTEAEEKTWMDIEAMFQDNKSWSSLVAALMKK